MSPNDSLPGNENTWRYVSLITLTLQNAILGLSMRYARTRPGDLFLSSTGNSQLLSSSHIYSAPLLPSRSYGRVRKAGHLSGAGLPGGGQERPALEERPALDNRQTAHGHVEGVRALARLHRPE